ncbi:mitotic spindle assembly checkpoint protein MAD1 [Tautonia sociabilis]|uniref:Uncharacterized protein n=1 Tax=Tautonia sociabilis TaxID=2080755 RepID=A0A432MLH7_9BACT|nr:hypothetical protein [Tautonia sociabilis]RUL88261.1 hypothetical protein TsocGM_07960 [Tautonia sociabilis]
MSRNARRRRERLVPQGWDAIGALADVAIVPGPEVDPSAADRLQGETDRLRRRVDEVEGRFRLVHRDRESIRKDRDRANSRVRELQAELNRLADEHEGLRAHLDRLRADSPHPATIVMEGAPQMNSVATLLGKAWRNKAVTVAALAVGLLVARDPAVSGAVRSVAESAASAVGRGDRENGYLGYARMVAASLEYEAARRAYNESADSLDGDALLEAQDNLRAARLRDREARLAFLPELARRCAEAGVPVPQRDAVALEDLKAELVR